MADEYLNRVPDFVLNVIGRLEEAGFEAFIVGGAVRDLLLEKMPEDWDVATNALPDDVKGLFQRTVDTGIKHGTVTVLVGKNKVEVTTYRQEQGYSDCRRPDRVRFVSDLKDDLSRRDFTVNALAFHPDTGFRDYYGGISDLSNRIIRCVGDPDLRFNEDALRMLRAVRFATVLDFALDKATMEAIVRLKAKIQKISAERIREEFFKILLSRHVERGLALLAESGLMEEIFPEVVGTFADGKNQPGVVIMKDSTFNLFKLVSRAPENIAIRLTCFLLPLAEGTRAEKAEPEGARPEGMQSGLGNQLGCARPEYAQSGSEKEHSGEAQSKWTQTERVQSIKGMSDAAQPKGENPEGDSRIIAFQKLRNVLHRLRTDRKTSGRVLSAAGALEWNPEPDFYAVKRELFQLGKDTFEDRLLLKKLLAEAGADAAKDAAGQLERIEEIKERIFEENQPVFLHDLAIGGSDLIKMGVSPGPVLGKILNILLEKVWKDPQCNRPDILLETAGNLIGCAENAKLQGNQEHLWTGRKK